MHGHNTRYSPGKGAPGRRHFLDRPWKLVFGGVHDSNGPHGDRDHGHEMAIQSDNGVSVLITWYLVNGLYIKPKK